MPQILVKSKAERGFRRAGIAFNRAGTVIDTADLTAEQLEAIEEEDNLSVEALEDGAPLPPKAKPAAKPAGKATAGKGKAKGSKAR